MLGLDPRRYTTLKQWNSEQKLYENIVGTYQIRKECRLLSYDLWSMVKKKKEKFDFLPCILLNES